MELLAEGLTGGAGGSVGRAVAFPFDTLKVKLATGDSGKGGVAATVRRTLREDGLLGFYRGVAFSVAEAMYQKFLYVLVYTSLKDFYKSLARREPTVLASLLCGYLSDLCCVPFSMPIEAMVVQLQTAAAGASRPAIIRKALFTYEGLSTSLRSGRAYLVLSLKAGLEFAIFDKCKALLLSRRPSEQDLAPAVAFSLGAVARAIATAVVYPYARGKALSQAQLAPSAYAAVLQVFRKEGAPALYRGLSMELSRGVTQAAVMFMVMERVRSVIKALVLGHR